VKRHLNHITAQIIYQSSYDNVNKVQYYESNDPDATLQIDDIDGDYVFSTFKQSDDHMRADYEKFVSSLVRTMDFENRLMLSAIRREKYAVVLYHASLSKYRATDAYMAAVNDGRHDVIKWLIDHKIVPNATPALMACALTGDLIDIGM
jgi:hypothetical protein